MPAGLVGIVISCQNCWHGLTEFVSFLFFASFFLLFHLLLSFYPPNSSCHPLSWVLLEFFVQLSVTKIDIRSRNKRPISICLDGEEFGPFVRIVIKPCEAIGSKDRLSLPVMHHFPLSAGHS